MINPMPTDFEKRLAIALVLREGKPKPVFAFCQQCRVAYAPNEGCQCKPHEKVTYPAPRYRGKAAATILINPDAHLGAVEKV